MALGIACLVPPEAETVVSLCASGLTDTSRGMAPAGMRRRRGMVLADMRWQSGMQWGEGAKEKGGGG